MQELIYTLSFNTSKKVTGLSGAYSLSLLAGEFDSGWICIKAQPKACFEEDNSSSVKKRSK